MTASEDRSWSRRVPSDDGDAAGGRPTPLSPGSAAEPLIYQTVQRAPGADGQFRPRRSAAERREEPELPPTQALPMQDVPRYRPRDFSPEGRRAVPSWAPTSGQTDAPLSERLDYHTLTRAEVRAAAERFGSGDPAGSGGANAASSGAGAPGSSGDGASGGSGAHGSWGSEGDGSGAGSDDSGSRASTPGTDSDASASGTGAAASSGTPSGPVSTPDQPLTRRQLRALREAQEAERSAPDSAPAPGSSDERSDDAPADRPATRPWAPVFYGEPVRTDENDPAGTPAESAPERPDSAEDAPEDESSGAAPSWSGSAPATFAIPVIPDDDLAAAPLSGSDVADPELVADGGTQETPEGADAASSSEASEAEALESEAPASGSAEAPVFSDAPSPAAPVESADGAPARSLDDWVAGLYAEQPPADDRPLELVEPPEPERWSGEGETDAPPTVLDDLFAPPAQRGEPAAGEVPAAGDAPDAAPDSSAGTETTAAASASGPRPVTDPLEFLDAAPSASDRVDLPAPSSWGQPTGPDQVQPTVVGQPPVEPPGSRADEDAIPVEAHDVATADGVEVHPVIIDADPLPAEPVPDVARAETPRESPGVPGAWTAHAAADDSHADVASGRDVGGGHGVVTTNALVLPSLPSPELSGPLTTTGEIVVTGSIDVPRSLSSTGAHPTQLDQSSLDHELDPGDQQVVSVDSQPVRAIKAVSTHTSTRGMMTSTKPHGNRGLTVLIIVTAGLAVVTLAVLAIGLVNNAF